MKLLSNRIVFSSLLSASLILASCGSESDTSTESATDTVATTTANEFEIDGTISSDYTNVNLLRLEDGNYEVVDSVVVADGKFSFKGKAEVPEMVYLMIAEGKYLPLFIEPTSLTIDIKGDAPEDMTVTGSATNDEWKTFNAKTSAIDQKLDDLYDEYMEASKVNDTAKLAQVEENYDALDDEKLSLIGNYIAENPESFVAGQLIVSNMMSTATPKELQGYLDSFSEDLKKSNYNSMITDRIAVMAKSEIGSVIADFSQEDEDGNTINVTDLRGKYVLLDFWASWCGPCRKENPNVVAAYNKHKDNNFTILGISLDDNKEKWLKAVEDDGLTWQHVSDLQGWGNAVAKEFGVRSIPHSILIDTEGVVLAKDLRGEDLHIFLDSLLVK